MDAVERGFIAEQFLAEIDALDRPPAGESPLKFALALDQKQLLTPPVAAVAQPHQVFDARILHTGNAFRHE